MTCRRGALSVTSHEPAAGVRRVGDHRIDVGSLFAGAIPVVDEDRHVGMCFGDDVDLIERDRMIESAEMEHRRHLR